MGSAFSGEGAVASSLNFAAREFPREIERKFFVAKLPPEIENYPCQAIEQGYLLITETNAEVRLRKAGGSFTLTVKSGGDMVRSEAEIEIDSVLFNDLWPATVGRRLEKTRYQVVYGDLTIQVDVYGGKLQGLILAEVEFDSLEESTRFVPPAWFGREVTADKRYKARELVLRG